MTAQTATATHTFADGIEKAAYEASHPAPATATQGPVRALVEEVAHLEAVAEHLADQHRVDSLRIAQLEGQLERAVTLATTSANQVRELTVRAEFAEKVAKMALADLTEAAKAGYVRR